jgi:transposase
MARYERRIELVFRQDDTALVASVGNTQEFRNGRELGRRAGIGTATLLQRRSQRAARDQQARSRYLRALMIHGARSALRVARKRNPRSIWISRIKLRRGPNVAAVPLASKNARVVWALLIRG